VSHCWMARNAGSVKKKNPTSRPNCASAMPNEPPLSARAKASHDSAAAVPAMNAASTATPSATVLVYRPTTSRIRAIASSQRSALLSTTRVGRSGVTRRAIMRFDHSTPRKATAETAPTPQRHASVRQNTPSCPSSSNQRASV